MPETNVPRYEVGILPRRGDMPEIAAVRRYEAGAPRRDDHG
jgi:hypothetical protein